MKSKLYKTKKEHNILKEFIKDLIEIEKIPEIKRMIPGRISRQQKGSSNKIMSFAYFTESGLKFNLKKGATAQELFVICNEDNKQVVHDKIKCLKLD